MARRPSAEPIYEVADLYRRTCFTTGHSLLWPEREAWNPTTLRQLWEAIIGHPDEGERNFEEKLRDQLSPLPDDATRVAAEAVAFYYLFSSKIGAKTKREKVQEIISWRFRDTPPNLGVLERAFAAGGVGGPGTYYSTSIPWQVAFTLKFAELALLDHTDLSNSAACQAVADRAVREVPKAAEARHILLHLLFPDQFETIASRTQKKRIAEAFARLAGGATDTDAALANIRKGLEAEYGRTDIDFYEPEIKARWRTGDGDDDITENLEAILAGYAKARASQPFSRESEMYQLFRRTETAFAKCQPVRDRPNLNVKASPGQGNWAAVPWISFLDSRETTTTQRGVYCVYLFREDMSGVYLTFNQGVTDPTKKEGWAAAEQSLRGTAAKVRQDFPQLSDHGFKLSDDIDLRTRGVLGGSYEVSTIAHKFYPSGAVPSEEELLSDLERVLEVYTEYVENKSRPGVSRRAWVFQANPDRYDLAGALSQKEEMAWLALQRASEMSVGDRVFMWESGARAGVVGYGTISAAAANTPFPQDEIVFSRDPEKFDGVQPRVRLLIDGVLRSRIEKAELERHPLLKELAIVRAPRMTNYLLTDAQGSALESLVRERMVTDKTPKPARDLVSPRRDLAAVVESFSQALEQCHLSFGSVHSRVVRSFVASLATKRFAIITGLSGSGKTQIALKLGAWLGEGRSKVVAVRPDWTGSDALFGYEDALQLPSEDGRRAWYAPEVLRFILQAARDPQWPYLLVLDEMNLAHVERYFADVLSGMETRLECIPNLVWEAGFWRLPADGPDKIAFPANLFVVGTVNVDETTYLFSPKVLDRSNTFEFRVETKDLASSAQRPLPIQAGDPALVRGLLAIAVDDRWHLDHPAPGQNEFAEHLRRFHSLLTEGGVEFGHRVFYEAIRFAAMHAAAGDQDVLRALDLQMMQKVLPRLHGSRRRLEVTLCAIGQFCHDLTFDAQLGLRDAVARFDPMQASPAAARLPVSFDKVVRMTRTLRANQFVSFTE